MADRPDLMPLVDICLRRMRAGESLDACLADYPAEAAELRPLLEVALLLRPISAPPAPNVTKRAANRARFLSQAATLQAPAPVDLPTALDACLRRIRSGESMARVLADYPQQAAALQPLIATALTVGAVPAAPAPDPAKRAAYRERFLTLAAAVLGVTHRVGANGHVPTTPPAPAPWYRRAYAALAAFLATPGYGRRVGLAAAGFVLILCVATSGVLAVSAESLPGDPLYPVKEVSRSVELALAFTPDAREAVLVKQETEKQVEIVLLQERPSRPPTVVVPSFSDVVTAIDADGIWTVGRVRVRVSPDMLAAIGSRVRVSGTLGPDGVVDATQVVVLASPPGGVKIAQQPAAQAAPTDGPSATPLAVSGAATATAPIPLALPTSALPQPLETATERAGRAEAAGKSSAGATGKPSAGATATPTLSGRVTPTVGAVAVAPKATATPAQILAQPTDEEPSATPGSTAAPTTELTPVPTVSPPQRVVERPTETGRKLDITLTGVRLAKLLTKNSGPNQVWLAYRSGDPSQPFYIVLDGGTQIEDGQLAEGRTIELRGQEADVSLLRATLGTLAAQLIPSLGDDSTAAQTDARSGSSQPSVLVVRARHIAVAADAPQVQDVTGRVLGRVARPDGQTWQWTLSVGGQQVAIIQDAATVVIGEIAADVRDMTAYVMYVVRDGAWVATRMELTPRPTPTPVPVEGQWYGPEVIRTINSIRREWTLASRVINVTDATIVTVLPVGANLADMTTPGTDYSPWDAPASVGDIARVFGTVDPSNARVINAQRIRVYPANRAPATATNPPRPTATNPPPTATNTPPPAATNTPRPTATNPPPTATNPPPPTATNPPPPTATNPPPATATNPPPPTATNPPPPTARADATRPPAANATAASRPGG